MKAIGHLEYGGPEVLRFVDVPLPALRPRDLLVRVKAFAINPVDAKRRRSGAAPLQTPQISGSSCSGLVKQLGPRVTLFYSGENPFTRHAARKVVLSSVATDGRGNRDIQLAYFAGKLAIR